MKRIFKPIHVHQSHVAHRWVCQFDPEEGKGEQPSARRLHRVVVEAANQFYLDDARRRLSLHAERRAPPPEATARVSFKVLALTALQANSDEQYLNIPRLVPAYLAVPCNMQCNFL